MSKLRMSLAALVSLVALLVAAAPALADEYTSLGDSYTAGPLIPLPLAPLGCLKSTTTTPHLARAEARPDAQRRELQRRDEGDMTTPQNVDAGPNPPQFDSLNADTTVVTLGDRRQRHRLHQHPQDCVAHQSVRLALQGQIHRRRQRPDQRPHRRHGAEGRGGARGDPQPLARGEVFVVNYPAILPDTGIGCWPQMPIAFGDVALPARQGEGAERDAGRRRPRQRRDGGRLVHREHRPRRLQVASDRWVEPIVPANPAAPVHPNATGMQRRRKRARGRLLETTPKRRRAGSGRPGQAAPAAAGCARVGWCSRHCPAILEPASEGPWPQPSRCCGHCTNVTTSSRSASASAG